MKAIHCMTDLEPYGIIALTGESDVHCYRILCDCTKKGKLIIERTMGTELKLAENWNGGKPEDPHIGSLLLPFEFVQSIAVFALLSDPDISEVWLLQRGSAMGFGVDDTDLKERLKIHHEGEIRNVFYPRPSDRHVHLFTGRTV
jgi:hypothetical protein